jgi:hypothetical protein
MLFPLLHFTQATGGGGYITMIIINFFYCSRIHPSNEVSTGDLGEKYKLSLARRSIFF